mmetsp:Transcript_15215/g.54774  ORF Transcript_15215/g.54774 Transcript_15215/m.54774 type:complete len:471 (+) Transcript_15215:2194-3606(+)
MNENMSTCPTGVSGMIRMITNGTNVKMSSVVRRIVCTSRGRSVLPVTALPKNRNDVPTSLNNIRTPLDMNSAPSFAFPTLSSVARTTRSPTISGDNDVSPSSAIPRRDLRSGMSVASSVSASSSMRSGAPRSTALTSFLSSASMTPNSATRSSTSSLLSGASSDGASAASSSSEPMMRSISACSVRTAKTRRSNDTFSSDSLIARASLTRDSESRPCAITFSRSLDASASARSRSCTSNVSFKTLFGRASGSNDGDGRSRKIGSAYPDDAPSMPPFNRTHTPFVYSAAPFAALSGLSRNLDTPSFTRPRVDLTSRPVFSAVFATIFSAAPPSPSKSSRSRPLASSIARSVSSTLPYGSDFKSATACRVSDALHSATRRAMASRADVADEADEASTKHASHAPAVSSIPESIASSLAHCASASTTRAHRLTYASTASASVSGSVTAASFGFPGGSGATSASTVSVARRTAK